MKISKISPIINFSRALTSNEIKSYQTLVAQAKKELNISDTTAIIFDFNIPSEKGYNTGIGSSWSYSAQDFCDFLKTYLAINSIQFEPQGEITSGNTSPFSGTNFALGYHIIDLKKLASDNYGNILNDEDIKEADANYREDKNRREYKTDYDYVLGMGYEEGIQNKLLKKAFEKFKTTDNNLKSEFFEFKNENDEFLYSFALFEVLSKKVYLSDNFLNWDEIDKELYNEKYPQDKRFARLRELNAKYQSDIEFEIFKQFIASKEQKESKQDFNEKNIKIYGDCLIGFAPSEVWAQRDCFKEGLYYGGPDPECPETNYIQPWGLNALDYTKLGECEEIGDLSQLGSVGKLLYSKYKTFLKRYDGIRIDAAWQLITPFIYRELNGLIKQESCPEISLTIMNILQSAANDVKNEKDGFSKDNVMLELVGINADRSRELTINQYPHLYSTSYAECDETPQKFREKGYMEGKYIVGVGNHDNESLVNLARNDYKRQSHLGGLKRDYNFSAGTSLCYDSENYKNQSEEDKIQEDFRNAKFSEIYTSKRQFFTLPDAFGMGERLNISGKSNPDNWRVRIPGDYERFYFSQLSKGYGLNLPKALQGALTMKKSNNLKLMEECSQAAQILRSDGPMTQIDADKEALEGKLGIEFKLN